MGNTEGQITQWADNARHTASEWLTTVGRATGFSACKVWHINLDGRPHVITVRHELSGERVVLINGKLVHHGDDDKILPIKLRNNHMAKLAVLYDEDTGDWLYELLLDGERVPEFNELTSLDCEPLRVSVVSYSVKTMGDSEVAMYRVESCRGDEEPAVAEHRFSEFADLDALIRSTFYSNHLLNSVPALPPKGSKLLADQLSPQFLEQRREALDIYMRKLMQLPRIPAHPDLLFFLSRSIFEPFQGVSTTFLGTSTFSPALTAEQLIERNRRRMQEEGFSTPPPAAAETVRAHRHFQQQEQQRGQAQASPGAAEPDHAAMLFGDVSGGREESL